MIRILVVDDSATSRALLTGMLSSEEDFRVVGEAQNGREALEMAERLQPDLITMDVQMPVMGGLEATRQIMVRSPRPIIIVSSTVRDDEVALSLEAMRAGALMVLPKPEGPLSPGFASDRRQIVSMVRAMSQVKVVRRHAGAASASDHSPASGAAHSPHTAVRARPASGSIRLVAIAASTGGPAAIRTILADLPRSFPVPIVVVQHIAKGFTSGLAHWLDCNTALTVKLAELGEHARPGTVYIAPDDRHVGCRLDGTGTIRIQLDDAPTVGVFRPSATYLFSSVATALGVHALSVILTGMGEDGVAGLRDAKASGGHVIAQDEASSVIFGMPREAARAGVVDSVIGIDGIARALVTLTA